VRYGRCRFWTSRPADGDSAALTELHHRQAARPRHRSVARPRHAVGRVRAERRAAHAPVAESRGTVGRASCGAASRRTRVRRRAVSGVNSRPDLVFFVLVAECGELCCFPRARVSLRRARATGAGNHDAVACPGVSGHLTGAAAETAPCRSDRGLAFRLGSGVARSRQQRVDERLEILAVGVAVVCRRPGRGGRRQHRVALGIGGTAKLPLLARPLGARAGAHE
jgi:hypothetical protein